MPRANYRNKLPSQAASSIYNEENDEVDLKGAILMGQMQQRPVNDDLQSYYHRRRSSKERPGKSKGRIDKSTEQIYMQKLDRKRWFMNHYLNAMGNTL